MKRVYNLVPKYRRRLQNVFSRLGDSYKLHKYKAQVKATLQNIEKYSTCSIPRKALMKRCYEYALDVFGHKKYAPWFYQYALIRGDFKEGWIPGDYFGQYVAPKGGLNLMTFYKTFTNRVLKTDLLPDLAYYINGLFYNPEFDVVAWPDLQKRLTKEYTNVFVKGDGAGQGRLVHKLKTVDLDQGTFERIGNSVTQSPVRQHPFFNAFITDSVATLRILTVVTPEGGVERRASHLRVGRIGGQWVDYKSQIRVPVSAEGEMDSYGYALDWQRWDQHPDTHVAFAGKHIPKFDEAVAACIRFHQMVPHFRIVGWDIAIDDSERVRLLEWNAALPAIKFSEATIGPCFADLNWEKLQYKGR